MLGGDNLIVAPSGNEPCSMRKLGGYEDATKFVTKIKVTFYRQILVVNKSC
jgi:hypothetical protein